MATKGNWADKFNTVKSKSFKTSENAEWRFSLEEHKEKGTIQLNARCFKIATTEGGYSGASRNGFIIPINKIEDLDKIKECFQTFIDFIDETKDYI